MHSTCLKRLACCPGRRLENSPSKVLAISCRHVALLTHPVIPACVGMTKRSPATASGFLFLAIRQMLGTHDRCESQKLMRGFTRA